MPLDHIHVKGAREHNLKNIDVKIPRDKMVVITGLSGSGKSSLAFDTIYAEGQRRYVESLSAYARQFLGQMEKPDVDFIEGLSPAVSIDQKGATRNPRSTVGTVTEIYDHLRLLFARVGVPHCPNHGIPIVAQHVQEIVDQIQSYPEGARLLILGPLVRDRKGEHQQLLVTARRGGFARVRVDGFVRDLSEDIVLDKMKKHTLEVVVDRFVVRRGPEGESDRSRLTDSVETALRLGEGLALVADADAKLPDRLFSERLACPEGDFSIGEIEPRTFSFNSPHGACPACTGIGTRLEPDPELILANPDLSVREGAVLPWQREKSTAAYRMAILVALARKVGFSLDTPAKDLPKKAIDAILHGIGGPLKLSYENRSGNRRSYEVDFEGIVGWVERSYKETTSDFTRLDLERYMSERPCPVCGGARLKPEVLAVKIGDKNIVDVSRLSVLEAVEWSNLLDKATGGPLGVRERTIARQVLKEIRQRLGFLKDVGLDYLTIDRAATTLSGGEAQRIRLATQIGSGLMGVLYILDEPSIGLHQRDNARLLATLERLRELGNTVIVVEHDEETMRAADHIVDMGPGAGEHGGRVVAAGTADEVMASKESVTGAYLSGRRAIPVPDRRIHDSGWFGVHGAAEHNLKQIDVDLPVGKFICVTGVSGSGKSTLVNEVIYKALVNRVTRSRVKPGAHRSVHGIEAFDKVIDIDQSPIGRTPRSNPATYTGLFDHIRALYAQTVDSKTRGYKPGRFSFNVKGGRCETCRGDGTIKIEMHFLPDVYINCEVCHGRRYNRETLEVKFKGKSIADVLDMPIEEALEFFAKIPKLRRRLQTLHDVGLDYMRLGQPATTLSGGEAQRVKLATELSKVATGRTLYILDEPTTGLHMYDVEKLLVVLQRLADAGNTVLVIEHNLDVIKQADWVLDLGPEGGDKGGEILAQGTPEEVAETPGSATGEFLRRVLPVYAAERALA
jgi:excinuclease ABC subunit A